MGPGLGEMVSAGKGLELFCEFSGDMRGFGSGESEGKEKFDCDNEMVKGIGLVDDVVGAGLLGRVNGVGCGTASKEAGVGADPWGRTARKCGPCHRTFLSLFLPLCGVRAFSSLSCAPTPSPPWDFSWDSSPPRLVLYPPPPCPPR